MKIYKFFSAVLCMAMLTGTIGGCGAAKEEKVTVVGQAEESDAEETESPAPVSAAEEAGEETAEEASSEVTDRISLDDSKEVNAEPAFAFSELEKYEFVFSSGVGAWATCLTVSEDGSFEGEYFDADMGDTGEGYPNGVMYRCNFSGKFTQPVQVNEYTYTMQIEELQLEQTPGTEKIQDGVRYIYSEPYGVSGAGEILLYLPGASIEELPEGFTSWISMTTGDFEASELTSYGLYNVETESGFLSYESEPAQPDVDIEKELADVAAKAQELEDKINNDPLSQYELNQAAAELYTLWDDELNTIWGYLKETLDEDTMNDLTEKEKEWVAYKDAEIAAAGAEFEGGSMQPMVEAATGAELTKARVYELAEYLK